ncbi:macrophage mannose receptor 1-like [Lingula anatina]|uniref:Macrophage mannose receptor 1-like n=1 Tax=Lingula anatina TaxID=7574 RepID=A0A1S3ILX9_LINAN|nr:macrophage mannose receptor 1-like [Lingula anatina]|eukprot:XP_013399078.2 macrophage mannose receptor 1-like [Lingula anatina]
MTVLSPSKDQMSRTEFWAGRERPDPPTESGTNLCVETVPTAEESRRSWVANECTKLRPFMCSKREGTCATGWRSHNGTCYQFNVNLKLSWYDAKDYCQSQGGDMVTVERRSTQDFIMSETNMIGISDGLNIWLGGSDIGFNPKVLRWGNEAAIGATGTYSNWVPGHPVTSSKPLCVQMLAADGKWVASNTCLQELPFICQISDKNVVYPPTVLPAKGSCDPGWVAYGFSCYYFDNSASVTWLQANQKCQDMGAHLVEMKNAREMSFIDKKMVAASWLGFTDRRREGHWTPYTNWAPKRPDDFHDGLSEHCAIILAGDPQGLWDDVPCDQLNAYICEKLIGPSTTPGPTSSETAVSVKCGLFWEDNPVSDHCYQFNTDTLSWTEAQLQCQHNGGDLASVTSLEEQLYISGSSGSGLGSSCMEMDASTGVWRDDQCQSRRGYVCKKKGNISSITPPSASVTTSSPGYPSCQEDWALYRDHCYRVFEDKNTWSQAKGSCRRMGGDLASILTANENSFVTSLAGGEDVDPSELWTGLNAGRVTNQYEWSDGSSVTVTYWAANEPDLQRREHCVSIYTSDDKDVHAAYKGSCYTLSNSGTTWSDANRMCNSSGGNLIAINDHLESAYISAYIGSTITDAEYWIGLSNDENGVYTWSTGDSVSVTNWGSGHTGNEKHVCVTMTQTGTSTGQWYDRPCSQHLGYVCEYPRGDYKTTPTPPTTISNTCSTEYPWTEYGGYCYKRVYLSHKYARTWSEAVQYCRNLGGDLASFHSEAQLMAVIGRFEYRSQFFWIGLSKPSPDSGYVWTDQSALDFTPWSTGQPDDHNGQEKCVQLDKKDGKWSDVNCYVRGNVICQFKKGEPIYTAGTTIVPTPAPQCGSDPEWVAFRDYCYYITQGYAPGSSMTWHDAREYCMKQAGELASIHDVMENSFILQQAARMMNADTFWIGLNELDLESYKWSDGTVTDFISWAKTEPNDYFGGQKCVEFSVKSGHWLDESCGKPNRYICKKHKDSRTTVTLPPTPVITGNCPPGFRGYGNKCYLVIGDSVDSTQLKTWGDARDTCSAMNSSFTLASVSNPLEAAFLTTLLKGKMVDFWIGLHKLRFRKFQWIDNTNVDYVNWGFGEPNGGLGTTSEEPCVSVSTRGISAGKWQDRPCVIKMGYVCQTWKDASYPTPQPSQSPSPCPLGYESFGDACYQVTAAMTWEEANATCRRQQDHLVSVLDGFEQTFLTLKVQELNKQSMWIGLTRTGSQYYWEDEWPVDYVNWAASEPPRNGTARCVMLMADGHWKATDCSLKFQGICKRTSAKPPVTVPDPPGTCPDGDWYPHGSHCYHLSTKNHYNDWYSAIMQCYLRGATLVSVTSQHEADFLVKLFQQSLVDNRPFWTGLYRKPNGTFNWYDGTPFNFANWATGQPGSDRGKDCIDMHPGTGKWQLSTCTYPLSHVCKTRKILPTTTPAPACRSGWYLYNGLCYKPFFKTSKDQKTWQSARSFCRSQGGDLASFHSSEESAWFGTIVGKAGLYSYGIDSNEPLWIGLYDTDVNKTYVSHVWSDGTPFDFSNWDIDQPDNHNGKERCVGMYANTGKWRDDNCAGARSWICRASLDATPLPSTTTPSGTDDDTCGDSWHSYGDHCYYISEGWGSTHRKSWFSARQWCMENAGDLLSIHTPGEADFVTTLVSKTDNIKSWIGANNLDLQGYRWTDGTLVNYINWGQGEPNSRYGLERCVNMYTGNDRTQPGTFNDDNCAAKLPFICKKHKLSKTTVSVPTTPPIEGYCPRGFDGIGNRCYKLFGEVQEGRRNWTGAASACAALGRQYTLASITNPLEQAFITSKLQFKVADYWIGLSDYYRTHFLQWLTNEELQYENWDVNEPSPSWQFNGEDCVLIRSAENSIGKWAEVKCSLTAGYICQTWKDPAIKTPWTTQPVSTLSNCKNGYSTLDGVTCYKLHQDAQTWADAHEICTEEGAYLTFVTGFLEEAHLITFLRHSDGSPVWLGLKGSRPHGFKWTMEWPLIFTHWAKDEPKSEKAEVCGVMMHDGTWNTRDCGTKLPFVCMTTSALPPVTTLPTTGWCPDQGQWIDHGSACFYYDTNAYLDWGEASFECYKIGGYLASFTSDNETSFILELLNEEVASRNLWIGLIKRRKEHYQWEDGTVVNYTNWSPAKPSATGDEERCAEFLPTSGLWNDVTCDGSRGYICKTSKIFPTVATSSTTTRTNTSSSTPPRHEEHVVRVAARAQGLTTGYTVGIALLSIIIVGLLGFFGYIVYNRPGKTEVSAFYNSEDGDKVEFSRTSDITDRPAA